jgi:hypothetical protein
MIVSSGRKNRSQRGYSASAVIGSSPPPTTSPSDPARSGAANVRELTRLDSSPRMSRNSTLGNAVEPTWVRCRPVSQSAIQQGMRPLLVPVF